MNRTVIFLLAVAMTSVVGPILPADADRVQIDPKTDWPCWRGPSRNGIAAPQKVPVEWSETKNVIWKTPVPGRGHGSPIVVGSRIFLESADEQAKTQFVLCFDRATGKELWRQEIHKGGFDGRWHGKNTRASSTLVSDGEQLYAAFYNQGAIWATALGHDGKQRWQTKLGDFESHWGYSASPTLYKSLVVIAADHKGTGYLAALDRKTGEARWRTPRPAEPTYASPVVLNVAGKDQLLIAGANLIASYDPDTGKALWSCKGTSTECVSSIIVEGDSIFATGGFPAKETVCVRADGSGKVVWRVPHGAFVPSMVVHGGSLYGILDDGIALCWQADSGKENWRERLAGKFSASPVLVGEHIYIPNEAGKTFVLKADAQKFAILGQNQLGSGMFASPVICGGRIYLRVVQQTTPKWEEILYCIGE
jgi:outer membrane protein assembly factor BamB